jgi:hypothetical protein
MHKPEPIEMLLRLVYLTPEWAHWFRMRAALHLEAGPIRCVRGLKSSFVIGQEVEIGPNSFTPRGRVDLVVCIFVNENNVCSDMARAHWTGCTQNEGPIPSLGISIEKKTCLYKNMFFFNEPDPLDHVENFWMALC